MFKKWHLNRNPFYTRPVNKLLSDDFVDRNDADDQISPRELLDGTHLIIGERGVGTTSYGNQIRFKDESIFSPDYEIRIEGMTNSKEILESIIYCLSKEMLNKKIKSKKAKEVVKTFEGTPNKPSFQIQAAGFGIGWSQNQSGGHEANIMSLTSIFEELCKEILKVKKFKNITIQLNNLEVPHIFTEEKMQNLIEPLRDIFQTNGVSWLLLGDKGFEELIMQKMNRVASIIKSTIHLPPMTEKLFIDIIKKRIKNSGPKATCPFENDALNTISRSSLGRTRFALELCSKMLEKFADQPIPQTITENEVVYEVKKRIDSIAASKNFPEHSLNILNIICKHPGINSSTLADKSSVKAGNIKKYAIPLEKEALISISKKGRQTIYHPSGFGLIIGNNRKQ